MDLVVVYLGLVSGLLFFTYSFAFVMSLLYCMQEQGACMPVGCYVFRTRLFAAKFSGPDCLLQSFQDQIVCCNVFRTRLFAAMFSGPDCLLHYARPGHPNPYWLQREARRCRLGSSWKDSCMRWVHGFISSNVTQCCNVM